jgi:hypothetical protein
LIKETTKQPVGENAVSIKIKCYKAALDYANTADMLDKANYALMLANSLKCERVTSTFDFFGEPQRNCIVMHKTNMFIELCPRCKKVSYALSKRRHYRRSLGATKGWIRKLGKQIQVKEDDS